MNSRTVFVVLNSIGLLATLIVNYLANALPLNGKTTGELSDAYPNLFVPAGITFAIWAVIYSLLLAFIIYQIVWLVRNDEARTNFLDQIGYWFLASSLFNVSWLFAWHWEIIGLSLVLMLGILISLIMIYVRLGIGLNEVVTGERLAVHIPISVYLGWISVATIANVTTLLVDIGWNGFGIAAATWAAIMVIVAAALAVLLLLQRKDFAYALVIIWALIGIIIKRMADNSQPDEAVITAAYVGIGLIVVAGIYKLIRG